MIETTDSYKYPGTIFHKSGSQDHLAIQANRAAQVPRRTYRNANIRVDAITQLFDNLVLPILTYCSEVRFPYTEQLKGDPIKQLFKSSTGYFLLLLLVCQTETPVSSMKVAVHFKSLRLPYSLRATGVWSGQIPFLSGS